MNITRALACGTLVIISQNSQWKEVDDYGCRWRINTNTKNMAEIIKKELDLPESERIKMGCRGRKLVKEKYSMARMTTELVDIYSKVMEQVTTP
ncbi:glycosyltransferase [Bacteroidaceae bacterium HV4-6-C5C]|jgi:glycosyltransferase involved in cell wall biosynthesis|nr:glycosyltransferase [Bacteroidaceae bacterium HV4-6-C5C]